MRCLALATDYDGTLATSGRVSAETVALLHKFRRSGRRVILVTGRVLQELLDVFPEAVEMDALVVENGAVWYEPETQRMELLGEKTPTELVTELQRGGASPLIVGKCIVATIEPYGKVALDAVHKLGLEHHIVFNKGSVMILPPGVDKGSGLRFALENLGLSPDNTIGIGDAENDHALLQAAGLGVAVANALPALKERADWVTEGAESSGVIEVLQASLLQNIKPA